MSNFYTLLNTFRAYENKLTILYETIFDFLSKNASDTSCLVHLNGAGSGNKHMHKQVYLRKFFLALYIQFYAVCNEKDLIEEKKVLERYWTHLQACYDKKFYKYFSQTELEGIEPPEQIDDAEDCNRLQKFKLGVASLELLTIIKAYADQFKKTKTTASTSKFLKANSTLENNLKQKFVELHAVCVEQNCFYHYWIFNSLIDMFVASISAFISQPNNYSKFLQDSFTLTFASIAFIYSQNAKYMFNSKEYSTKTVAKLTFLKPAHFFQSTIKFVDTFLELSTVDLFFVLPLNNFQFIYFE